MRATQGFLHKSHRRFSGHKPEARKGAQEAEGTQDVTSVSRMGPVGTSGGWKLTCRRKAQLCTASVKRAFHFTTEHALVQTIHTSQQAQRIELLNSQDAKQSHGGDAPPRRCCI